LLGIGLHKVVHRYILRLVEKQIPQDAEEAQAAFTDGIAAAKTPNWLIPEMRQLWDWFPQHWDLPIDKFLTTEERQETDRVGYTPDLVLAHPETNTLEIQDFKFGWAPPLTEEELRDLFQARVYSFYAMKRWPGFSNYRFTIIAARFNKAVSVVFTLSDLDNVEREIQAYIATIEECQRTGIWPAIPGPSCRFCELQCPLVDDLAIVPKRFLQADQAQQIAGLILAAQAWTKTAKKALKGYVAGHGPVSVNGVVWADRPVTERKYPLDAVLKVLHERGAMGAFEFDPANPLTISHSALAKTFKLFPALKDDLEPYVQQKDAYRFSAKRGTEEQGED
jgi:hypothetical protein